jgi:hypothetical protein
MVSMRECVYKLHPSYPPRFDHPNNILYRIQIMKVLIMQVPLTSCYFALLRSNFSSALSSQTSSSQFPPLGQETKFQNQYKTTCKTAGNFYSLCFWRGKGTTKSLNWMVASIHFLCECIHYQPFSLNLVFYVSCFCNFALWNWSNFLHVITYWTSEVLTIKRHCLKTLPHMNVC